MNNLSRKTALAGVFEHPTRFAPDKTIYQIMAESLRARLTTQALTSRMSTASALPGIGMAGLGVDRAVRLSQPDAELCRFDLSADRSFVAHTMHAAAAIAAGLCKVAVVVYGSTAASQRFAIGTGGGGGGSDPCDQFDGAVRADYGRLLCDDRAAPHARIRHNFRAARRNSGHDAPARFDESGGQVSRTDHGRGCDGLADHFLAAASARLLHHQRRRRRAGGDLGRARARPQEEAGLHPRMRRDRAASGARAARFHGDGGVAIGASSPSSAPESLQAISTWR